MVRVFIHVVEGACDRRELDANKIIEFLSANNHEIVDKPEQADFIILVTCAAVKGITDCSLSKVLEFQKYDAELIVSGCLPAIEKKKLSKLFDGKTYAPKELKELSAIFSTDNQNSWERIADSNFRFFDEDSGPVINRLHTLSNKFKTMRTFFVELEDFLLKHKYGKNSRLYAWYSQKSRLFLIRTSEGCLGNCTYCAIKKAIGSLKSKPLETCINEFKTGLEKEYKKFIITGDDTGAYGLDINSNFPQLLNKLTSIKGDYNLRILCLNPRWLVKYITELEKLVKNTNVKYIEIPIQSGSDRILKLMNRGYETEKIKNALLRLKAANPDVILFTDYILGFPTETKEEFQKTISFIKEIDFDGFIIPFCCKPGTPAEQIEPKVSESEIKTRLLVAESFFKRAGYIVDSSETHMSFEKKRDFQ